MVRAQASQNMPKGESRVRKRELQISHENTICHRSTRFWGVFTAKPHPSVDLLQIVPVALS